ncbi:MAG TPA: glycosyltransferase [Chthoniobacterales bacterium]|nr:glycosyltransferase [Chthoniobacterales bacterium]
MKICDITQFYSPVSGGVKRYLHEKLDYIERHTSRDQGALIVPGPKTKVEVRGRSRIYSIRSPLISRTGRYRALVNLRAVGATLKRERPDIIESGDPYQLGWRAVRSGRALGIPVVGFYHSHFPEAYLLASARLFGKRAAGRVMKLSRGYVRRLYNRFAATLVASDRIAQILRDWGVHNVHVVKLGVNIEVFHPGESDREPVRQSLGVELGRKLLLYVGRLAKEKNTAKLFKAIAMLNARAPGSFHLLVIGEGPQRKQLRELQGQHQNVSWIPYCAEPRELARYYRAADLFVHPGVQETFGLVALESQACGTPVVGIRGSAMDDLVFHDQNEWAAENSAEALTDAIQAFAGKDLSSIGLQAAEQAARLYAWPKVFERLFCIYREVCASYRDMVQK